MFQDTNGQYLRMRESVGSMFDLSPFFVKYMLWFTT